MRGCIYDLDSDKNNLVPSILDIFLIGRAELERLCGYLLSSYLPLCVS